MKNLMLVVSHEHDPIWVVAGDNSLDSSKLFQFAEMITRGRDTGGEIIISFCHHFSSDPQTNVLLLF